MPSVEELDSDEEPELYNVSSVLNSINTSLAGIGGECVLKRKNEKHQGVCHDATEGDLKRLDYNVKLKATTHYLNQLEWEEKLDWAMKRKEEGNRRYKRKNYTGAVTKYMDAIMALDFGEEEKN